MFFRCPEFWNTSKIHHSEYMWNICCIQYCISTKYVHFENIILVKWYSKKHVKFYEPNNSGKFFALPNVYQNQQRNERGKLHSNGVSKM